MGWVVPSIIQREWTGVRYRADEWERFCREHRLRIKRVELPNNLSAIVCDVVILPLECDPFVLARLAWHEIGHWATHVGNRTAWLSMIQGEYILGKFERQAWEFAILFPDWGCFLAEDQWAG